MLALIGSFLLCQRRAVATALAQGTQGTLALDARRSVEDQDPVEVIDLVLDDPRLKARCLD